MLPAYMRQTCYRFAALHTLLLLYLPEHGDPALQRVNRCPALLLDTCWPY